MIYNIEPLIRKMHAEDISSASAARISAIGGILGELVRFSADAPRLFADLYHVAVDRFGTAATLPEQSAWLQALVHLGEAQEELFSHVIDEAEYTRLVNREETVRQSWLEAMKAVTESTSAAWAALPLSDRLHRLQTFYRQDINRLSGGNDRHARTMLDKASHRFEQCREEIFRHRNFGIETYLLYYWALSVAHPGSRRPAHLPYYKEYFHIFDCLDDQFAKGSDLEWQYLEVLWHYRFQAEHHYDPSLLSGLSQADPSACSDFRRQCYEWMLDLAPDDDGSIQEMHDHNHFIRQGIQSLQSWLDAKADNHVAVSAEQELEALLTLSCAQKAGNFVPMLSSTVEHRAYQLLPRLGSTRQKAHLMVHVALDTLDDTLLAEADTLLATWANTPLTPEDHFLLQLHRPAQSATA